MARAGGGGAMSPRPPSPVRQRVDTPAADAAFGGAHAALTIERRKPVKRSIPTLLASGVLAAAMLASVPLSAHAKRDGAGAVQNATLGPRPFFLVDDMRDGPLKRELQQCAKRGAFTPREFSIGHRGAPLQFPEHTVESYVAAARMGAGIVECDVAFTKDKELVCRHAQNDLHTTTNILVTPLAAKCTQPFVPATFDAAGHRLTPARAECRTSDITLAEFKTLRGKMDASDPNARTAAEYLGGTANWRTDLYAGPSSGTLLSHKESIELFKRLGVKMTPELKFPAVAMPFDGFTQEDYARKLIDEYKAAGVRPSQVWPQSFHQPDVLYWVRHEPEFGRQAVYLDDASTTADLPTLAELKEVRAQGIRIVAPPTFALLDVDPAGRIVPSAYARNAKSAGLDIITWTLERSGILADGRNGFYYQTFDSTIEREGDVMTVLDVLAREVGVLGVFSDWPATTTFYANCAGLR
jgi:glycerophosphoryl diester phosphodiesterase